MALRLVAEIVIPGSLVKVVVREQIDAVSRNQCEHVVPAFKVSAMACEFDVHGVAVNQLVNAALAKICAIELIVQALGMFGPQCPNGSRVGVEKSLGQSV